MIDFTEIDKDILINRDKGTNEYNEGIFLYFKNMRNKCGKIRRMLIASITTVKNKTTQK